MLCRRPFSDGFSHRRVAAHAADPGAPWGNQNEKKRVVEMFKKIKGIHLTKIVKKKHQNWHVLPKIAAQKRCNFQWFCNFCVWNWIMKMFKFIPICDGVVHTLSQNTVNTSVFCSGVTKRVHCKY